MLNVKDRDWCRPGQVIFVSFPSSFRLTTRSGLGAPADRQQRIVAPTLLCVGGVPKQIKMAIEAEIENKFVYYLNSRCCRIPL